MTTKEEFDAAIKMINSCIATIKCGCEYDELQADWLYFKCKNFIKEYKEKYERMEKGV